MPHTTLVKNLFDAYTEKGREMERAYILFLFYLIKTRDALGPEKKEFEDYLRRTRLIALLCFLSCEPEHCESLFKKLKKIRPALLIKGYSSRNIIKLIEGWPSNEDMIRGSCKKKSCKEGLVDRFFSFKYKRAGVLKNARRIQNNRLSDQRETMIRIRQGLCLTIPHVNTLLKGVTLKIIYENDSNEEVKKIIRRNPELMYFNELAFRNSFQ